MIALGVPGLADERTRALAEALGAVIAHTPAEVPDPPLFGLVVLPAGSPRRRLIELDAGLWRRTLDANLTFAMELCRVAAPRIAASGGGSIVLVTSAVVEEPGEVHRAAAAGAVVAFARALAVELGGAGVRVNAVCVEPARLPEVLPVLQLLLSDAAAYVTGEVLELGRAVVPTRWA